jgi:hypothetical protein
LISEFQLADQHVDPLQYALYLFSGQEPQIVWPSYQPRPEFRPGDSSDELLEGYLDSIPGHQADTICLHHCVIWRRCISRHERSLPEESEIILTWSKTHVLPIRPDPFPTRTLQEVPGMAVSVAESGREGKHPSIQCSNSHREARRLSKIVFKNHGEIVSVAECPPCSGGIPTLGNRHFGRGSKPTWQGGHSLPAYECRVKMTQLPSDLDVAALRPLVWQWRRSVCGEEDHGPPSLVEIKAQYARNQYGNPCREIPVEPDLAARSRHGLSILTRSGYLQNHDLSGNFQLVDGGSRETANQKDARQGVDGWFSTYPTKRGGERPMSSPVAHYLPSSLNHHLYEILPG